MKAASSRLTNQDLEQMRVRMGGATAGPYQSEWDADEEAFVVARGVPRDQVIAVFPLFENPNAERDAELTAHTGTDLPRLLDEVEARGREIEVLRAALQEIKDVPDTVQQSWWEATLDMQRRAHAALSLIANHTPEEQKA